MTKLLLLWCVQLELSRSVVKLVNDASGSTSTGHNFLSELRQLLARHTIAVAQSATEHEVCVLIVDVRLIS